MYNAIHANGIIAEMQSRRVAAMAAVGEVMEEVVVAIKVGTVSFNVNLLYVACDCGHINPHSDKRQQ